MSTFNQKISLPLLVVFLGTVIGALSGQFVWSLVAAVGVAVLVRVVQNLSSFQRAIDGTERNVSSDTEGVMIKWPSETSNWLKQWDDEVTYSQSFEDTPGNIWNRSVSASDH